MKVLLLLLPIFLCFSCAVPANRSSKQAPSSSRLKINRPGVGSKLDSDIAKLVLSGNLRWAKILCNDVIFSSRSVKDRETGKYWSCLIEALEAIQEKNYSMAQLIISKNQPEFKVSYHLFYFNLLNEMLVRITKLDHDNRQLRLDTKKSQQIEQLELKNQQITKKNEILNQKIQNLESLMRQLEEMQ